MTHDRKPSADELLKRAQKAVSKPLPPAASLKKQKPIILPEGYAELLKGKTVAEHNAILAKLKEGEYETSSPELKEIRLLYTTTKQLAANTDAYLAKAKKALIRSNRMRKDCKRIARTLRDELSNIVGTDPLAISPKNAR